MHGLARSVTIGLGFQNWQMQHCTLIPACWKEGVGLPDKNGFIFIFHVNVPSNKMDLLHLPILLPLVICIAARLVRQNYKGHIKEEEISNRWRIRNEWGKKDVDALCYLT